MSGSVRVDTTKIDADFLADVVVLLYDQPDEFVVTSGDRDGAVEQAGYAAWLADPTQPKFTNPANSAHVGANFPDGKSRALDVTLVRDGKDVWDYADAGWQALIAAVRAHPRLHSGADFTDAHGNPTPDEDHIEKVDWRADKATA